MTRAEYKEQFRTRRRQENRDYVYQYKLNRPCACCGRHYPPEVMDFHHRDPIDKDGEVARGSNNCWSIKRLQEEIDKCELLCANCHRLVHSNLVSFGTVA